jgi:RNA polymerase sigma-70 factor, ECF subfamily
MDESHDEETSKKMSLIGRIESGPTGLSNDPRLAAAKVDLAERWRALDACRSYLRLVARRGRWSSDARQAATSDLVQKTIVDAWRNFSRFKGTTPGQLRAWLKTILVHSALNARRRPLMVSLDLGRAGREIAGASTSPSDHLQRETSRHALDAGLKGLPEHFRATIHMRIWDQLTFAQIGRRLGISEDSARKLFARAVVKLGESLGPGHAPG